MFTRIRRAWRVLTRKSLYGGDFSMRDLTIQVTRAPNGMTVLYFDLTDEEELIVALPRVGALELLDCLLAVLQHPEDEGILHDA